MKTTVIIVFALAFLVNAKAIGQKDEIPKKSNEETLKVYCTTDVYDLTQEWVNEYRNLNPNLTIEVKTGSYSTSIEGQKNEGILIVTSNAFKNNSFQAADNIVIGRQVIVPIINSKNPILSDLSSTGISVKALSALLSNSRLTNTTPVIINNKTVKFNYYSIKDDFISNMVDRFININHSNLTSKRVENTKMLMQNIKSDPYGLGFCLLSDAIDADKQTFVEGISLLPIDRNGNGKLDYMEQIYNNPEAFLRGVWIGKYPGELVSNLYAITPVNHINDEQNALLNWILVEGQKKLGEYGFQGLISNEMTSSLNKIENFKEKNISVLDRQSNLKAILIFVAVLVLMGLLIDFALFRYSRRLSKKVGNYNQQILYNDNSISAPKGLFFDKSHTWVFMEKNGQVKIGMSDFLPSITGTLTAVILKKTGESIKKGETLLTLKQEGKQLNIKAPVSGTIKTLNDKLFRDASLINFSPYNEGWIYAIEPSNWSREIQFLLMFDKFKEWLKSEYLRLKDFLAMLKTSEDSLQSVIVIQDGGEVRKSVLKDLDPKVWEDFQQHFINEM